MKLILLFAVMLMAVMAFGVAGFAADMPDSIDVAGMASDAGVGMPLVFSTMQGDHAATFTDYKSVKAGMPGNHFIGRTTIEDAAGFLTKLKPGADAVSLTADKTMNDKETNAGVARLVSDSILVSHSVRGCACFCRVVEPALV